MPSRIDDRWLWMGFGIFFFFAARGIRRTIKDINTLIATDPSESQEKFRNPPQPEDSISLETLKTLASSPNSNIANSAINLIIARFIELPDAHEIIAKDASSSNETIRKKARSTIAFLRAWPLPLGMSGQHIPIELPRDSSLIPPPGLPPQSIDEWEAYFRSRPIDLNSGVMDRQDDLEEWVVPSSERPIAGWTAIPRALPLQVHGEIDNAMESYDAIQRRRRREAMVLHEGPGWFGESDIIRPP
ncbi:hypothetical protein M433DRAFT_387594 [Acidomyces richmondensis BFW]|jgi:hypothetical protein|nr:hypothetical protein M433DRAFT_387594 [Acidomyces richmondensis BFW]